RSEQRFDGRHRPQLGAVRELHRPSVADGTLRPGALRPGATTPVGRPSGREVACSPHRDGNRRGGWHHGRVTSTNLLGGIPPTMLPDDAPPRIALDAGTSATDVAAAHPEASLPWAVLAEQA